MGTIYATIDDSVRQFLQAQPVFFVGTAPLDPEGHVNVSPKGLDTFRVLGPREVAYLDLTGSGIETVGHLKENGRIVLMFCAFQGAPKIIRLYGKGRVIERHPAEFSELAAQFTNYEGAGDIITVKISRSADSCGFGGPRMQYYATRDQRN